MQINIKRYRDPELTSLLQDFENKGGCLKFRVFKIAENYDGWLPHDDYRKHMVVARQALEFENFINNQQANSYADVGQRHASEDLKTDYKILDRSGQECTLEEFMGPFYDLVREKPIIRGRLGNDTANFYFYFDAEECVGNKLDIQLDVDKYYAKYPDSSGGFVSAFLEPPYNMQLGDSIKDRGDYLLKYTKYLFDDLTQLSIFKWSCDCSTFFDAGKEWHGTFFWTVYNPTKDWYVGICGSATD